MYGIASTGVGEQKVKFVSEDPKWEPWHNINIMDTANESWAEQLIYINSTTSGLFSECFHIN